MEASTPWIRPRTGYIREYRNGGGPLKTTSANAPVVSNALRVRMRRERTEIVLTPPGQPPDAKAARYVTVDLPRLPHTRPPRVPLVRAAKELGKRRRDFTAAVGVRHPSALFALPISRLSVFIV